MSIFLQHSDLIHNPSVTLDEIFTYLNQADKPCLIAIDEFQQISRYDDETIEATIRTYVQRCTNAHRCIYRLLCGQV